MASVRGGRVQLSTAIASIGIGLLTARVFLRAQLHETLQLPSLAASLAVIAWPAPLLRRITGPELARND